MMGNHKAIALSNPLLESLKGWILELDDFSTIQADEVIMVGSFRGGFISRFPILKFSSSGQTQLGQQLERAVNGDVADPRMGLSHLGINLREALVAGGVQEDVENLLPLLGCLQSFSRDPCFEKPGFNQSPPQS